MMKKSYRLLAPIAAAMLTMQASAAVITLDFEGIDPTESNGVEIAGYYNGGTASNGASGTNYGVEFIGGAYALCLNRDGIYCSNTSRGEAGPSNAAGLYWLSASPIMNVAAGFLGGFSFNYSSPFYTASVQVYDGINGTGNVLGSTALGLTPLAACPESYTLGAAFCPFVPASVSFAGVAKSIVFGGTADAVSFDDITFGSVTPGQGDGPSPAPEPASWALMIGGFGVVGSMARRASRKAARSLA